MNELQPHPLCALFPKIGDDELQDLALDIQANGLMNPICLEQGTDLILDGIHRYLACMAVGVEPRFFYFQGSDEKKLTFVMAMNFKRRHLTASQRAAIVALAQDWEKAAKQGGSKIKINEINDSKSATLHFSSSEDRAKNANVSLRTQKDADALSKTDSALLREVAEGKLSVNQAVQQIKPRREPAERPVFEKSSTTIPTPVSPDSTNLVIEPDPESVDAELDADMQKDFLAEYDAVCRERDDLQRLLDELQSDEAKAAKSWREKFHALEGRNAQLNTTLQECIKEAKSAQFVNKKLREIVFAVSNKDLIEKVQELVDRSLNGTR